MPYKVFVPSMCPPPLYGIVNSETWRFKYASCFMYPQYEYTPYNPQQNKRRQQGSDTIAHISTYLVTLSSTDCAGKSMTRERSVASSCTVSASLSIVLGEVRRRQLQDAISPMPSDPLWFLGRGWSAPGAWRTAVIIKASTRSIGDFSKRLRCECRLCSRAIRRVTLGVLAFSLEAMH